MPSTVFGERTQSVPRVWCVTMSEYICPNCRGGFPEPLANGVNEEMQCPWCGEAIDGNYEHEQFIEAVSRENSDDEQSDHWVSLFR